MSDKDYSLLRPFDLEAAKAGAELFYTRPKNDENKCVFISQKGNEVCVHFKEFGFSIYDDSDIADGLRMAPLCWVEGKPVYKGDVLWHTARGTKVIADKVSSNGSLIEPGCTAGDYLSNLTWTPPKVKREGWVNIIPYSKHGSCGELKDRIVRNCDIFPDQESASEFALQCGDVIACVRIEWEE